MYTKVVVPCIYVTTKSQCLFSNIERKNTLMHKLKMTIFNVRKRKEKYMWIMYILVFIFYVYFNSAWCRIQNIHNQCILIYITIAETLLSRCFMVFCSLSWKYSDHLLFVVHLSVNVYIFNVFSKTTDQILNRFGTNHHWVKEILNCSNKGPGLLQRGDNHKNAKMGWDHWKIFSPEPLSLNMSYWHESFII